MRLKPACARASTRSASTVRGSTSIAYSPPVANWTLPGVLLGLLSAGLAVGVAATALWGRRIPVHDLAVRAGRPALTALRRLHSGHLGDYVAWLMTGMVALAALVGLPQL